MRQPPIPPSRTGRPLPPSWTAQVGSGRALPPVPVPQPKTDRLAHLGGLINQVIPKGSLAHQTGVRHITNWGSENMPQADLKIANNWLEVISKEHFMGDKLSAHWRVWMANSKERSFWDYLQKLPSSQRDMLSEYQVFYANDLLTRSLFEAYFHGGKLQSRMEPELQEGLMAARGLENQKQEIRKLAASSEIKYVDTMNWPSQAITNFEPKGWACFVFSTTGVIYIGKHMGGKFHHSSFLCGAPIRAAGMLKVKNGDIVEIHEKNGHYQADTNDLCFFLEYLRKRGARLDHITVILFSGERTTADRVLKEYFLPQKPEVKDGKHEIPFPLEQSNNNNVKPAFPPKASGRKLPPVPVKPDPSKKDQSMFYFTRG